MKNFTRFPAIFAIVAAFFLTSCVETVVVASVATGIIVTREKSFSSTRYDIAIEARIASSFLRNGLKNPGNSVDVIVNEGRVLLIGIVRDPQRAKMASELAWRVPGVKEVIDEIQLHDDKFYLKDFSRGLADYLITGEIETKLFLKKGISSSNYKITTVGHVVYMIGVAAEDDEMQKVLSIVSSIRGVDKVVNHVILANDRRRQ